MELQSTEAFFEHLLKLMGSIRLVLGGQGVALEIFGVVICLLVMDGVLTTGKEVEDGMEAEVELHL
jgi:hypothetical protein